MPSQDDNAAPPDLEVARRVVEEERAERVAACSAEIQRVLKRYRCELEVVPARLAITARD